METEKNDTITIKKDTLWRYSTFMLLAVVIIGVIVWILPDKSVTGNVIQQPGQQLPSGPTAKITVDTEGDPVKGSEDAPVEFVEFTDYQCPYCQRHFLQTGSALDARIEAGDIKLITKDFPLSFHQNAQKAAEAAHCARDQGGNVKYYEMHDLLFIKGSGDGTGLDAASLKQYAKDLGLNSATFDSCLDSGKFADDVQADLAYGSQIGISGTPGFFINGRLVSGACPASVFNAAIDAELDGKEWNVDRCQLALLS